MPRYDIGNAVASDMTNKVDSYAVLPMITDGAMNQEETEWSNSRWSQQWAYFNKISELKSALLMKAIWHVGKGYTTDELTQIKLNRIFGWGKDTFDDILFNACLVSFIGGDSYTAVMRDDAGNLINLKPLSPDTIKTIVGRDGIILRYEQHSRLPGGRITKKEFKPEQIFHISNNRLADQIHGISDIDSIEKIILADAENFDDMTKAMHRQVIPFIIFKLKTDDPVKIREIADLIDSKIISKRENLFIPDDDNIISYEVVQINPSAIIMQWRDDLRNKFYRSVGLPQIIFGSSGATESGGKIEYLAHEQVFEKAQRYLEKQIEAQIGLKINLIPPVTLLENLQTDEKKDIGGIGFQTNDITAGSGK